MRIVTWNCFRGECRTRAAKLDVLAPDITVLQECGAPTAPTDDLCVWFGRTAVQGVGVVTRGAWTVEPGPVDVNVPDSAYPVRISGPTAFHMLAVWAQPRPTYVRALLDALERYRTFLSAAPSVVVGDFNSHPLWDVRDRKANHSTLVEVLRRDFGLASAFHAAMARAPGMEEAPTLYWQWQQAQPFHIDYCFIPEHWVPNLRAVHIDGYAEWATESDHRPLVVEVGA